MILSTTQLIPIIIIMHFSKIASGWTLSLKSKNAIAGGLQKWIRQFGGPAITASEMRTVFAVKDYYRPSAAVLFKRDKPDTIQPYGHVCDCMNGNG